VESYICASLLPLVPSGPAENGSPGGAGKKP
jgi:hypothetical protein